MKRTAVTVVVGTVVVGAVALTGCAISIRSIGQRSSSRAAVAPLSSAAPVSPASPSLAPASPSLVPVSPAPPPSATAAGATYLALVAPLNTTTFALDTAVFDSPSDPTTGSLSAVIAASAASIETFNDHLRSDTWPRTAEPDITTLAATDDVIVALLKGYEADLQSPKPGADFDTVLRALQVADSAYAIDRGLASDDSARVRSDLGLPPPSVPRVTLND